MQIRKLLMSRFVTKIVKYWIKSISGIVEAVFFKLGTSNVYHRRGRMTPVVQLPWQQFCRWSVIKTIPSFCLNQGPSTPANLMMRRQMVIVSVWNRTLVLLWEIDNKDIWFLTEKEWSQENFLDNDTYGFYLVSLVMDISGAGLETTAFIFSEIFFTQYFTIYW